MGKEETVCKKAWKNIRDRYVKAKKKSHGRSGDPGGNKHVSPILVELGWLSQFVKHRSTDTNLEREAENTELSSQEHIIQLETVCLPTSTGLLQLTDPSMPTTSGTFTPSPNSAFSPAVASLPAVSTSGTFRCSSPSPLSFAPSTSTPLSLPTSPKPTSSPLPLPSFSHSTPCPSSSHSSPLTISPSPIPSPLSSSQSFRPIPNSLRASPCPSISPRPIASSTNCNSARKKKYTTEEAVLKRLEQLDQERERVKQQDNEDFHFAVIIADMLGKIHPNHKSEVKFQLYQAMFEAEKKYPK
ncbi:uncharacterized protein LOC134310067 [Trichomycterus rosablanca]|uniref:uncharacterized protein LOC134310067 n=1 Tax=Trichomycterus rosablanca TaxID=2290929 RepID=UPI002F359EDF